MALIGTFYASAAFTPCDLHLKVGYGGTNMMPASDADDVQCLAVLPSCRLAVLTSCLPAFLIFIVPSFLVFFKLYPLIYSSKGIDIWTFELPRRFIRHDVL
jgi:hypothetical protein